MGTDTHPHKYLSIYMEDTYQERLQAMSEHMGASRSSLAKALTYMAMEGLTLGRLLPLLEGSHDIMLRTEQMSIVVNQSKVPPEYLRHRVTRIERGETLAIYIEPLYWLQDETTRMTRNLITRLEGEIYEKQDREA